LSSSTSFTVNYACFVIDHLACGIIASLFTCCLLTRARWRKLFLPSTIDHPSEYRTSFDSGVTCDSWTFLTLSYPCLVYQTSKESMCLGRTGYNRLSNDDVVHFKCPSLDSVSHHVVSKVNVTGHNYERQYRCPWTPVLGSHLEMQWKSNLTNSFLKCYSPRTSLQASDSTMYTVLVNDTSMTGYLCV